MTKQTSRTISYAQLVRQYQTEDQKRKKEVEFQFSNGRKFLHARNPYQSRSRSCSAIGQAGVVGYGHSGCAIVGVD